MSLPTTAWTTPEAQAALADDAIVFPRGRARVDADALPDSFASAFAATSRRMWVESPMLVLGWATCTALLLLTGLLLHSGPPAATPAATMAPQPVAATGQGAVPPVAGSPQPATVAPTAPTPFARSGAALAIGFTHALDGRFRIGSGRHSSGYGYGSGSGSRCGLLTGCRHSCTGIGNGGCGSGSGSGGSFPSLRTMVLLLGIVLGLVGPLTVALQARRDARDGWARARGFRPGGHLDDGDVPIVRRALAVDPGQSFLGEVGPYPATVGTVSLSSQPRQETTLDTPWDTRRIPTDHSGVTWSMVHLQLPSHVAAMFAGVALSRRGTVWPSTVDPAWEEYSLGDNTVALTYQLHASPRQEAAALPALLTEDFAAVLAGTGGQLQLQQVGRDLYVFQQGAASPAVFDGLCRAALLVALQFDRAAASRPVSTPGGYAVAAPAVGYAAVAPEPPEEPPAYSHNAA